MVRPIQREYLFCPGGLLDLMGFYGFFVVFAANRAQSSGTSRLPNFRVPISRLRQGGFA
jgi:hypothetical protein